MYVCTYIYVFLGIGGCLLVQERELNRVENLFYQTCYNLKGNCEECLCIWEMVSR